MNHGKAFKIARAVKGLQQRELAKLAGLTASHLSLIEAGKRRPSVGALHKVSQALEMPTHLLTLLAAESEDLSLVDPQELTALGESLARLLVKDERAMSKTARKGK
ncbi:MAG TPA: helix-turn-helix transcriptional regulator [Blastocatellia bacterium]|nr:helix-turn-helix transcriptional regulator [Blastocatellia bacterium]